jgi:hypothetical protein
MGMASALYTFILENFWTKVGLKVLFRIPSIEKILLVFVEYLFPSHRKMLQNMPVQRPKGSIPTNGLPSSRLVTNPKELSITFKPQCKCKVVTEITH